MAMLDLRASINVMPFSVYQELKIGPLKPSRAVIQLADKLSVYPLGIVEDVLVKVQDLIFPADFYVLNMCNTPTKKPLMLLGRPFLQTARTLIDCETGRLTCMFAGETVTFYTYRAGQFPPDMEMVDFVESIELLVEETLPTMIVKDKYDRIIQTGKTIINMNGDVYGEEEFEVLGELNIEEEEQLKLYPPPS